MSSVEVGGAEVDLGTIGLDIEAEALSEVRVTAERNAAQTERDRAEATTAFVTGLFDAADPFAWLPREQRGAPA